MRPSVYAVLPFVGFALVAPGEPPPPRPSPAIDRQAGFEPPEVILDGLELGDRLYPHYADFDGDGTTDLLVGVSDRLLVYLNRGTDAEPEYAEPTWFDDAEPSGLIPSG